jgi:hypothetical protein
VGLRGMDLHGAGEHQRRGKRRVRNGCDLHFIPLSGAKRALGRGLPFERTTDAPNDRAPVTGTTVRRTVRPLPRVRRSDGEITVPRPSPGPKQERPDAGRSPGSRVIA